MNDTFEGHIYISSAKAILFQSHYWEAPVWLPLSQIEMATEIDSIEYVIKVKDWLCKKKDIHEFTYYSEIEMKARQD